MKPIASRKEGWVIVPSAIAFYEKDQIVCFALDGAHSRVAALPNGLTFAQFLDDYNRCTDAIYFID